MKYKRIFLIVLDSFGIGNAPDAEKFGDFGANTLKSISKSEKFNISNLRKLGLCNVDGVELESYASPIGKFGALQELSAGKDTTIGHWEIAGIITKEPFPTYTENGFPTEVIKAFEEAIGTKCIGNYAASGTVIIQDLGPEHVKTGYPIVYTSADSVFQIAAHEDVISVEKLYEICEKARRILTGKHGVARVIARPFIGNEAEGFTRTKNRKDFSLEPTGVTILDLAKEKELEVVAIGKIEDIFEGRVKEVPKTSDTLYAIVCSMTAYAKEHKDNREMIENSLRYAEKMPADYVSILLKNYESIDHNFKDILINLPAYTRLLNKRSTMRNGSVR